MTNGTKKLVLKYARPDADDLVLDGDVGGVPGPVDVGYAETPAPGRL